MARSVQDPREKPEKKNPPVPNEEPDPLERQKNNPTRIQEPPEESEPRIDDPQPDQLQV